MGERFLMNPHEGKVLLAHAGRTEALQFTWGAIEAIRAKWGDDYAKRMGLALDTPVLVDTAFLIAVTTGKQADDVMAWSPPIGPASAAISQAWQAAWFGPDAPSAEKKDDAENPLKALPLLAKLSGLRLRLPFAPASRGEISGG